MPRLVRSKNPDHIIGYGSVFQVGDDVDAKQKGTASRQAACCGPVRYMEPIACAISEEEKTAAQRWSRACTQAPSLGFLGDFF